MKAFILAAGLGTRLKPITDSKPKALVEICGMTLLEITLKRLTQFGFNEIIMNVHHYADQVEDYLKEKNNFGADIKISDERNLLLDTGGGLKKASWFFEEGKPFLIHNVDILSDINLFQLYNQHTQSNSIATLAVQNRISSRYILFDDYKNLCGWKNEKTGETKITRSPAGELKQFAFSGIQIVDPVIFKLMPDKEIFSLVDLYLSAASKKSITYFNHDSTLFLDLGKKENLAEAENLILKIL